MWSSDVHKREHCDGGWCWINLIKDDDGKNHTVQMLSNLRFFAPLLFLLIYYLLVLGYHFSFSRCSNDDNNRRLGPAPTPDQRSAALQATETYNNHSACPLRSCKTKDYTGTSAAMPRHHCLSNCSINTLQHLCFASDGDAVWEVAKTLIIQLLQQ